MKISVVFFVGFFLFGCVGAKPQTALNTISAYISGATDSLHDEVKECYEQLKNTPQWKAVTDLINGNDFQNILERIQETQAYKMLVNYFNKMLKRYERVLNTIIS